MSEAELPCAKVAVTTLLIYETGAPKGIRPDSPAVLAVTEGLPRTEIDRPNRKEVIFGCAAAGGICEFSFSVCQNERLTPPSDPAQRICVDDEKLLSTFRYLMRETFGPMVSLLRLI